MFFAPLLFCFFNQVGEFVIAKEALPCKAYQEGESNFALEIADILWSYCDYSSEYFLTKIQSP